jgi:hypothetical protein
MIMASAFCNEYGFVPQLNILQGIALKAVRRSGIDSADLVEGVIIQEMYGSRRAHSLCFQSFVRSNIEVIIHLM